jgi:hypothetical protein
MMRNKALAGLQKTYDDSYLSCSTAVYYEGQVRRIFYLAITSDTIPKSITY